MMGYGKPIDLETFERLQAVAKKDLMEQHGNAMTSTSVDFEPSRSSLG